MGLFQLSLWPLLWQVQHSDLLKQSIGEMTQDYQIRNYLLCAAVISSIVLCMQHVQWKRRTKQPRPDISQQGPCKNPEPNPSIDEGWACARLLCCFFIFILGTLDSHDTGQLFWSVHDSWTPQYSELTYYVSPPTEEKQRRSPKLSLQVYASVLVGLAMKSETYHRRILLLHHDTLMALVFFVYAYQDIWPLATYSQEPVDSQTILMWSKILLFFMDGILIPLITPYLKIFLSKNENQGSDRFT